MCYLPLKRDAQVTQAMKPPLTIAQSVSAQVLDLWEPPARRVLSSAGEVTGMPPSPFPSQ